MTFDDFEKLTTVADCDGLLVAYKKMGWPIPSELLARRETLKAQSLSVYGDFKSRNRPSEELAGCIERAADALLDPTLDAKEALKPVMLYGKIQSGKTRAFVGVMSIAFDRGVDIAVVYTKGTNALAMQTVSRMKSEFSYFKPGSNLLHQCTIVVHDVLDLGSQELTPYELETQKHIIVCKKEANNTRCLKEIFEGNTLMRRKRVIVIDDEADFGGIAFFRDRQAHGVGVGTNAKYITETVLSIPDCRNMLVTATPYSLYLQPDGMSELVNGRVRPLKPRHTETVPVHMRYVGGKQYFIDSLRADSMFHSVFHPLSPDCMDVLCDRNQRYINNIAKSPNLRDFREAILQYLVATAIRSIQEERKGILYRSSFIVHVKISRAAHQWQKALIDAFRDYLGQHVFCEQPDDSSFDNRIDSIHKGFADARKNGENEGFLDNDEMPSVAEVVARIRHLFATDAIYVQVVNSDADVANLLNAAGQLELRHEANVFVGGSILDRGITIENLIGFVYGRSPQRMQMDTVLQHARMYGARNMADMAVTRFHTTGRLYDCLRRIHAMDESLRDQFERAMREGRDMKDVFVCRDANGRIVPCSPSRLLIASISTIAPNSRHLPVGFQTDCYTAIHETISAIDEAIRSAPDYRNRDADGIFKMDRDLAIDLLRRIRSTYIYSRPIDENAGLEWKVEEMIGVLEWALDRRGEVYCLRRDNRDLGRVRENGAFANAPDDGRMDLAPARAKAVDVPVLMFIKENGKRENGWRDAPFYWPVLLVQQNVRSAVYGSAGKES